MGAARIIFVALALLTVVLSVRMVTTQKIVHSLLLHIVTLSSLGIAYLVAGAYLIGAVQIMVYAGSVTVMFVFALMLAPQTADQHESLDHSSRLRAIAAAVAAFAIAALAFLALPDARSPIGEVGIEAISESLFTVYAYPFELLALVLTAALVGVAVVVGRSSEAEASTPTEEVDAP